MAVSVQDFSQILAQLGPTFPPQNLSASGNGLSINTASVGTDRICAQLLIGDATALTSLDVKMQAAPDDGTGSPGSWADISGATFTQVTTDPGTTTATVPETIVFQLPPALTYSTRPYQWVRAVATLVGTSIYMSVNLLAVRKYEQQAAYVNAPGNNGDNVIN